MNEFNEPLITELNTESEEKLEIVFNTLMEIKGILDKDPVFSKLELSPIVAGGAIRDLLTNKSSLIKDIDIFLSFECLVTEDTKLMQEFKKQCLNLGYVSINHEPTEAALTDSQFILKALHHVMNKYYLHIQPIESKESTLSFDDTVNISKIDEYQTLGINGVLKIQDTELAYPIDLIINYISPSSVMEIFDFDICKAYLVSFLDEQMNVINNARNNLRLTQEFKESVGLKQLTFMTMYWDEIAIQRSFEKHLPRLITKYPEYEVTFEQLSEKSQAILEKVLLEFKFNQPIGNKTNKKVKI